MKALSIILLSCAVVMTLSRCAVYDIADAEAWWSDEVAENLPDTSVDRADQAFHDLVAVDDYSVVEAEETFSDAMDPVTRRWSFLGLEEAFSDWEWLQRLAEIFSIAALDDKVSEAQGR